MSAFAEPSPAVADQVEVSVPTWEEAYREHALGLVQLATAIVGPADAADLVSDAMVRVLTSGGWPRGVIDPRAYFSQAVVNEARRRWRSDETTT